MVIEEIRLISALRREVEKLNAALAETERLIASVERFAVPTANAEAPEPRPDGRGGVA